MLHTLIPSLRDCGKSTQKQDYLGIQELLFHSASMVSLMRCSHYYTLYRPAGVDYCHFYSYQLIDSSLEIADL